MLAPACQNSRSTEPKFRLLYLGNDLKLITTLRQALAEPVYLLVTCADRESAVLFLKSDIQYEVLLIDLEWRGKNGLKVARLARKLRHRKRMPIVLLASVKFESPEADGCGGSWRNHMDVKDGRHCGCNQTSEG